MTKTVRTALVAGGLVAAAVAAASLIPVLKKLADDLRELHYMLEDDDGYTEDQIDQYRVKDPEVLKRISEDLENYPEGWVTHERPVRKPDPEPAAE